MERKLTSILAADVVGYSRMMESAEVETLAALKAHRAELFDAQVQEHNGRIIKLMGDGALAEFGSVVDAVACGVAIQEGMAERNRQVPEERKLRLRIGVHLGDVIVEGDDLYGDGVNIAARLESLAEPGGMCISRPAYDQIGAGLQSRFQNLGERPLKNISRPLQVYALLPEGVKAKPAARRDRLPMGKLAGAAVIAALLGLGALIWPQMSERMAESPSLPVSPPSAPEGPALAVLPFENLSEEAEQEYFADGMTEDLVTDLSKISSISVLGRTATAGFKGKQVDIPLAGQELGVRYFISGSVRKAGERLRINAQLIDAQNGNQIWAERYDGTQDDVFLLQDEVLEKIVSSLSLKLSEEERERLARRGTKSTAAHDLYLQGLYHESAFNQQENRTAMALYRQALSIDPDYPLPYARMSNILQLDARNGWSEDVEGDLKQAVALAEKAVALDPLNPVLHWSLGRSQARLRTPEALQQGIQSVKRAIELDPDYADAYAILGVLYVGSGNAEDAKRSIETAMRLNPNYPFWYLFMRGTTHYVVEDYEAAIADFEAAAEKSPTAQFVRFWLAAAYAQAGRMEDAEWQVDELMIMGFDGSVSTIVETGHILDPDYLALEKEGLRKAGFPD